MTPLLFAAALALAPTPAQPGQGFDPRFILPPSNPSAPPVAAACANLTNLTVAPDGTPFRKLNELPPGVFEHAVWRSLNGCPVREVVYDGRTYYVQSSPPRLEIGPAVGSRMARYNARPEPRAQPAPDQEKAP